VDTGMVRVPRPRPGEPEPTGEERDRRIEAEIAALRALHPVGRLGAPEDVAHAVRYLLTADFATGTVLVVDGGLSLGQPG
jgi:NAD(P)-dependent dehydrogenase (short-subunit alcohol dehydrogenase family)